MSDRRFSTDTKEERSSVNFETRDIFGSDFDPVPYNENNRTGDIFETRDRSDQPYRVVDYVCIPLTALILIWVVCNYEDILLGIISVILPVFSMLLGLGGFILLLCLFLRRR